MIWADASSNQRRRGGKMPATYRPGHHHRRSRAARLNHSPPVSTTGAGQSWVEGATGGRSWSHVCDLNINVLFDGPAKQVHRGPSDLPRVVVRVGVDPYGAN